MDSAMATPAPAAPSGPSAMQSIAALLPAPAHPPPKRNDTVALKVRLAEILDAEHGQLYWTGLTDFVAGRINRTEWDEVMRKAFGADPSIRIQALKLHNALLLSILYNTTRPFLPPSSVRHSGFHPRGAKKRALAGQGADGLATAAEDKRRRLVRDKVMALGRRERGEIKLLGSASTVLAPAQKSKLAKESAEAEERRRRRLAEGHPLSEAVGGTSRGGGGRVDPDGTPRALRDREREGAVLPGTFAQDYGRLVQLPLCCESRMLPDAEIMRERMLALAYEEGMVEGVEARGAGLLQSAIEHHLRNMFASVISMVRGKRPASPPLLPRTTASSAVSTPVPSTTSTFAPAGAAPAAPVASVPMSDAADANSLSDDPERTPLTIADFHALFALSPSLLGRYPTSAAVERMYAIAPPESESDSDDYSDSDDDGSVATGAAHANGAQDKGKSTSTDAAGDSKMVPPTSASAGQQNPAATMATGQGAGKYPRLSRSRASSFYGATRPVRASVSGASPVVSASVGPASGARPPRFVLDPSSTHGVPLGHPDVPPLRPTPAPVLPVHLGGPAAAAATPSTVPAGPAVAGGTGAAGDGGSGLSPKSLALRNSLFPELAPASSGGGSAGASGSATPGTGAAEAAAAGSAAPPGEGDGNGTSTDAGSDSEDDGAHAKRSRNPGLKIKFGQSVPGAPIPQQQGPGTGRPMPTNKRDKEAGRKLWEVVDSVGLLDGVLQ